MTAIIKAIVAAIAEAFFRFVWSKKNEVIEMVDDTGTEWDDLEETNINSNDIVEHSDNDSND
jgi:hypothetical protein